MLNTWNSLKIKAMIEKNSGQKRVGNGWLDRLTNYLSTGCRRTNFTTAL